MPRGIESFEDYEDHEEQQYYSTGTWRAWAERLRFQSHPPKMFKKGMEQVAWLVLHLLRSQPPAIGEDMVKQFCERVLKVEEDAAEEVPF